MSVFKTIRWPLCCLIIFLQSCSNRSSYVEFVPTKADSIAELSKIKRAFIQLGIAAKNIRNGDLITRTGNDFTSESLRMLNRRNTTYSHCGIANIEHDSVFIYHSLGGEWNPNQKIRRDPLGDFSDPSSNKGIGVFRFNLQDSSISRLIAVVKEFYSRGVTFDMDFDLSTDDRMYCAEFVYKSYLKSSDGKMHFNHSHIKTFEFIGVDDIFLHPLCAMQQQIVYK